MKMAANPADARNQLENMALPVPRGTPPNPHNARKPRFHGKLVAPEEQFQQSPGLYGQREQHTKGRLPLQRIGSRGLRIARTCSPIPVQEPIDTIVNQQHE